MLMRRRVLVDRSAARGGRDQGPQAFQCHVSRQSHCGPRTWLVVRRPRGKALIYTISQKTTAKALIYTVRTPKLVSHTLTMDQLACVIKKFMPYSDFYHNFVKGISPISLIWMCNYIKTESGERRKVNLSCYKIHRNKWNILK